MNRSKAITILAGFVCSTLAMAQEFESSDSMGSADSMGSMDSAMSQPTTMDTQPAFTPASDFQPPSSVDFGPNAWDTEPRPPASGSFFGAGAQPMSSPDEFVMPELPSSFDNQSLSGANQALEARTDPAVWQDVNGGTGPTGISQGELSSAWTDAQSQSSDSALAAYKVEAQAEAERLAYAEQQRKTDYDPARAAAVESCVAGFDNGACVASDSARQQTASLVGEDLTELLDYQHNRSWNNTRVQEMSEQLDNLSESAGTVASVTSTLSSVADTKLDRDELKDLVADDLTGRAQDVFTDAAIDVQADGRATTITPPAVTTTTIGADGVPTIKAEVEKTDYSAGVTKVTVDMLKDTKDVVENLNKPIVATTLMGANFVKYATQNEGGPGAANAVQENRNEKEIARADALNTAIQKVAARDPNWTKNSALPPEVAAASRSFQTSDSRQGGAMVEKLYWQAWAKARDHQRTVGNHTARQ